MVTNHLRHYKTTCLQISSQTHAHTLADDRPTVTWMNPTLRSSGIVVMDSYPILDLDQMRMIMKYAMVNAEQKWIGKPSTKLPKVHNIIWIPLTRFCSFFWHAHCLCWPQLCLKFSLSYIQRKKIHYPSPPPFSPVPPHVSMHTHVVLYKGRPQEVV